MEYCPLIIDFPSNSSYSVFNNNPIFFIDVDGMSPIPNLDRVTHVEDVLKGTKCIEYGSNILRTKTFLWFEISREISTGECADYSRLQVRQGKDGNKYTAVVSKKRVDMYVDESRQSDKSKLDLQKGVSVIVKNLKNGRAVMAGVMYDPTHNTGNPNAATNHYVTIVGMGEDDKGVYFSYYDNFTGNVGGENVRRDTQLNRFRLNIRPDGTSYFSDSDNTLPYNANQQNEIGNAQNGSPTRYILTEVRDNE